jgi:hypothetical protein
MRSTPRTCYTFHCRNDQGRQDFVVVGGARRHLAGAIVVSRGERNVLFLAQNEQTRSDLPAFVNLFKARSVDSNMFVDQGMTRLMVMTMEDRCGRFVALAITAKFYGG